MHTLLRASLLALVVLSACTSTPAGIDGSIVQPDSSGLNDLGASSDAAPSDAGQSGDDARVDSDASLGADAVSPPDSGVASADAGSPPEDSGVNPDVGSNPDAEPTTDGGSAPDAGPSCQAVCAQGSPPGAPTTPLALTTLVADVARAQCHALFRCCSDLDRRDYFAPIRRDGEADWELASFRSRLPPEAAGFTETDCATVMTEILDVMPLGPWVRAAQASRVTFDAAEYQSCMTALESAACGEPLRNALYDSTCLSFSPPGGGSEQRRLFHRTATSGPCDPIPDGTGGRVYGSCDPTQAFCCFRAPGAPAAPCWIAGGGRIGTCAPASQASQTCGINFGQRDAQFCATGLYCDGNTGMCAAEAVMSLQLGDTCFANNNTVGQCPPNSYCDAFGTALCTVYRAQGDSCDSGEQCSTGLCR